MKTNLLSLILITSVLLVSACQSSQAGTKESSAEEIRTSFNNNDVEQLLKIIQPPLFIRHQEWASANDGSGFILGNYSDINLPSINEVKLFLNKLVTEIEIEATLAITEDITLNNLKDNLRKSEHLWQDLDLVLYLRGEADVEHIVLLGLDKKTHRLRAIYYN